VAPQFGASLTDDARVVIYNPKMFIIQATELIIVGALRPSPVLSANVRLGCMRQPLTLAYNNSESDTAVESFMELKLYSQHSVS
jgi:hypothetical protein